MDLFLFPIQNEISDAIIQLVGAMDTRQTIDQMQFAWK